MTGKHRSPRRSASRNLAATAAVLAAGALPVAAAGSAFADTPVSTPEIASPLGAATGPLGSMLPVGGMAPMAGDLGTALSYATAGDQLITGNIGGTDLSATPSRDTALGAKATNDASALAATAKELATKLASQVPFDHLVDQVSPSVAGQQVPLTPIASTVGAETAQLADSAAVQAQPVVGRLKQSGVPTVGDVTTGLSQTDVPVFGTVGGVTSALPVGTMLGSEAPVLGTLDAASAL